MKEGDLIAIRPPYYTLAAAPLAFEGSREFSDRIRTIVGSCTLRNPCHNAFHRIDYNNY
jgi:hypothetical protein